MAGLLGDSIDDPRTMALFAGIQGLLGGRGTMQGISQGLLNYGGTMQQAKQQAAQEEERKQRAAAQALQMQQHQLQLAEAKKAAALRDQQQQFLQTLPSPQFQSGQESLGAVAGSGAVRPENGKPMIGPSLLAAQMQPKVDPQQEQLLQAVKAGVMPYETYLASQRKDNTPIKLGAGEALIDPRTMKPLASNPKDDAPSAIKEYQFAKLQGYPGTFQQFQLEQKRAGASSVSVNTGQHGFDNTLKLRSDFRSEPVYKAHQEMQSAYSQIQQALKAGTPVGDLAGATKIMKLLDPGSVVRESELGMAMASTGLLDRATNYASMIVNGHKLTPKQRQEFQTLADSLLAQSANLYNTKRGEYGQIAKRNSLNFDDVTGAEASVPRVPSLVATPRAENQNDPLGLFSR